MKKLTIAALTIFALASSPPIHSFAEAAHTAQQEQQELSENTVTSNSGSETHAQIEATEEKVLGHDAHEKLEVLHVATESHPILSLSVVGVLSILALSAVIYCVRRKKTRS